MTATIQTETLTDGSTVYNVMRNGEAVAHPATLKEAESICQVLNMPTPALELADRQLWEAKQVIEERWLLHYRELERRRNAESQAELREKIRAELLAEQQLSNAVS